MSLNALVECADTVCLHKFTHSSTQHNAAYTMTLHCKLLMYCQRSNDNTGWSCIL